ncbi:hypothetical protein H4I96_01449 [Botrytis cinerea]
MQFSTASVMTLVLGLGLSVHGYILPRALNKANEYPEEKCLAKNGSNKPTWAHTPSLCACVSLDKTDVSAYLVAMSGQRMLAYSNQNCNPGINGEDGLGDIGGAVPNWTHTSRKAELGVCTGIHQPFARLERQSWTASKLSLLMPLKWRLMESSRSRNKETRDLDSLRANIEFV